MKKQKKSEYKQESNFRKSWNYIKSIRNYIYFTIVVFLIFTFLAIFLPVPASLEELIKNEIKTLIEKTSGLNSWEMILFIFKNNFMVSLIGTFAGILFCFIPFSITLFNGYVIGYVIRMVIEQLGMFDGTLSLWKLLPHGIFELPAVFISLAMGLRFGVSFMISLYKNNFRIILGDLKNILIVIVFIILPLLVIAAIIEGLLVGFLG